MAARHSAYMKPPVVGFGNLKAEGVVVFFGASDQDLPSTFQGVLDQPRVFDV